MSALTCDRCGLPPARGPLGFRVFVERDGALWCSPCVGAAITPAMRAALDRQAEQGAAAERDCNTLRPFLRIGTGTTVARLAMLSWLPAVRVRGMIARMDGQGYRIKRIPQRHGAPYLYRLCECCNTRA